MTGVRQLDALTGLRGIAAWLVVLYHIRPALTALLPAEVIAALAKGYLAVDLFFMLSGFVIWYNYADRLRTGGDAAVRQFLWRRLARIWPLHGAILAAYIGFVGLLAASGRSIADYPLHELPLHLLLVQNWGFTSALAWNHPAWSISTEFAAYLLFPLLTLSGLHRLRLPGLLLVAAGLVAGIALRFLADGHAGLGADIPGLGLWRCLGGFALGAVLCRVWQACRFGAAWAFAAGATLLAAGLALGLPEPWLVPPVLFAGLLALVLDQGPVNRLLASRALRLLGEISYSTYLGHFLLWALWKLLFVGPSLQLGWPGLAGFLATVLAASIGLHRGLERPAQRWLNARQPAWAMPRRAAHPQ